MEQGASTHADVAEEWPTLPWLALAAVVGLLPMLALLPSALPQADDFCLADIWRRHGFWDGYWQLYATWTPRVPLALGMMAPAALADLTGLSLTASYRLVLAALLLLLALAVRWMAGLLLPGSRPWQRWALTVLLLFVLAGNARPLRDLLFWLGAASYYVPAGLAIGLCFLLLVRSEVARWHAVAATALAALAGVAVEFGGGAVALAALTAWLIAGRSRLCLAVALVGLAGTLFLGLAPGTAARLASGTQQGEPLRALLESLPLTLQFHAMAESSPGFFGLLLLLLLRPREPGPSRLWPALALCLALPAFAFGLTLAGSGIVLPARAQLALQVALLPVLCWLALRWRPAWLRHRRLRWLAILLLLASPNLWMALSEQGDARAYAGAGEARLTALAAAGVVDDSVPPLPAYPALLHQEELSADPAHWINVCAASLYGRDGLRLEDGGRPAPGALQPYWFLWPFAAPP